MKKAINIRMDEDLLNDLNTYAKKFDRTRTYLIKKAVSSYFDTLDEIKAGKVELFIIEEVLKEAGLDV